MKQFLTFFFFVIFFSASAQVKKGQPPATEKPKLIVGIVIDQMRWDYLYRYNSQYTAGGFKRLLAEGFSFDNCLIPYVPTYTAVGHASLYTGTVPAYHGIVGNNWYEKSIGKGMYCTSDSTVQSLGGSDYAGKQSPANMWSTTITDELRLASNFTSKVIGVALKDRGSILPAGHSANAAYWYDAGKFITSTHYMKELPQWVKDFNAKERVLSLMSKDWATLHPINTYKESDGDSAAYEGTIPGLDNTTFPHHISKLSNKQKYSALASTPFGNTLTFEFSKAAIEAEKLGQGIATDFLAVSFSSPDYVGHTFGPNSIEQEDNYLRFDKELEEFLIYLDKKIGKGQYLLFLSADHAAANIPAYLNGKKIPAGVFNESAIQKKLDSAVSARFMLKGAITTVMNYQVYLNKSAIESGGKKLEEVEDFIVSELLKEPYITNVWKNEYINAASIAEPVRSMVINGYTPKRSGEIQFNAKPAYFDGGYRGTTHGSWNPYDAHIPLLFYGWKIPHGSSKHLVHNTDAAPTIAALLKIQMPNATVGRVLEEIVK